MVEGNFLHADSLGNNGRLEPGAAQVMRFSSRGDLHSEKNGSTTEPMRFIQFWILPSEAGLDSAAQQHQYREQDRTDRWLQIMSPRGADGLDLAQDARVYVARLTAGKQLTHSFGEGRGGYVYLIGGAANLDGEPVTTGDAAKIHGPHEFTVEATADTELINIDVPLRFTPVGMWAGR